MATVAIVGTGIEQTLDWLCDKLKSERSDFTRNQTNHTVRTKENLYVIVTDESHANGWVFNDYIVAPTYYHLADYVRTRIR